MAKIMIQGTGSTVGKSIIVSALCRIFKQDGYSVCPFKSQNMSLNSYITLDGKEMGRAQVLQAYASGLQPEAYMNPILLKPTSDKKCQIIVNGKVYGNSTAMEYHNMKLEFRDMLQDHFKKMEKSFEIIVMEGAGSPAEINLRDRDIVNMGMAEIADAPVLLAGDIDKGGVFASLAGTMLFFTEEEKKRVKGTIINKFRGDIDILKPGLKMLQDVVNVPCIGVIPHFNLALEDEDGAVEFNKKVTAPIDIAVIKLPHISNFTDLDALKSEDDVSVRFITSTEEFGNPDLLIIPGSKNTIEDLIKIRQCGLEDCIKKYSESGIVIGVCGGYQILGNIISDPYKTETDMGEVEGMGLLDIETVFEKEKVTTRIKALSNADFPIIKEDGSLEKRKLDVYGYEIHMGICKYGAKAKPLFKFIEKNGKKVDIDDGAVNERKNVFGTYIHGVFDATDFREYILNRIRQNKGLSYKKSKVYEDLREGEIEKLAGIVRKSLDIDKIYTIMGLRR